LRCKKLNIGYVYIANVIPTNL